MSPCALAAVSAKNIEPVPEFELQRMVMPTSVAAGAITKSSAAAWGDAAAPPT